MNLQHFAEGEGDTVPTNSGSNTQTTQSIDYGKIQGMIDTATAKKENAVLKSFFEQSGLSEAETKEAINAYKADKQAKEQAKANELETYKAQANDALARAEKAELQMQTTSVGLQLGLDAKTLGYVQRMADMSNVKDEKGNISAENIKAAFEQVLKDFPTLRGDKQSQGFQIGADGNKQQVQTDNTNDIRAMFGLKAK